VVVHSNKDDDLEPVEVQEADVHEFAAEQLERHVGFVADVVLIDETKLSGVIIAVSATSLIIESWDSGTHAINGDLSTIAIESVRRVSIP
jgi:hypothetical protein